MDSRGSVLVLKKEALLQELDKEKEKRMLQQPLKPGRLKGKHVFIRITDFYDAKESVRHVLGVENRG